MSTTITVSILTASRENVLTQIWGREKLGTATGAY